VRCSIHGSAFSGSIHGQGSLRFKSVSRRRSQTAWHPAPFATDQAGMRSMGKFG
jgi:hypothetical protein